jgi:hypothetical protein
MRLPAGMVDRILEARAYSRGYVVYQARGQGKVDPPILQLVKANDLQLVQDALDARRTA